MRKPTRNTVSAFTLGPTPGEARNVASTEEAFRLFFNYDIIVLTWANKKIYPAASRFARTATYSHTELSEIRTLLGVLVTSSQKNDGHIPTSDM